MKEIIRAELLETKWGRTIDLEGKVDLSDYLSRNPPQKTLAFLDYGGNCRDFDIGKEYECEISYSRSYETTPASNNKNRISIHGDSIKEVEEKTEQILKELKENPKYVDAPRLRPVIQAYFRIIKT